MSCKSCQVPFTFFNKGKACPQDQGGCSNKFCSKCLDFALSSPDCSKITTYCQQCHQKKSILDYSTQYEIMGAEEGISILFVHGAGGCRLMFRPHAQELAKKGYRCVLIDLPGHGTKSNDILTLESAIDFIVTQTKLHCKEYKGVKPVYVGGSLGGYIGMELLGQHPNLYSGAVIAMAGQDVGEQRGWAASAGLFAMQKVIPMISASTALSGMISQAKKNGHIPMELIYSIAGGSGMFFHQGSAHVDILYRSNPRKSLKEFPGKVLFVNGSLDHRDSEAVWLSCCKQGKLNVYEGGDHFFSHDDRFMTRFISDIEQHCQWVQQ